MIFAKENYTVGFASLTSCFIIAVFVFTPLSTLDFCSTYLAFLHCVAVFCSGGEKKFIQKMYWSASISNRFNMSIEICFVGRSWIKMAGSQGTIRPHQMSMLRRIKYGPYWFVLVTIHYSLQG